MQEETKQNDQPATAPAPAPLATVKAGAELNVNPAAAFRVGLEPTTFEGAIKLAEIAAKAKIGGCEKADDALVRLMAGREVGLTAFASLTHVYVVNGRPSLDSITILALCLRSPLCEDFSLVESTEKKATYRAKRKGRNARELTWTHEMAVRAQLVKKDSNWEKYPEAMLRARCITALARIEFPEAIGGFFEVDEARTTVTVDPETGEVKDVSPGRADSARIPVDSRDFEKEFGTLEEQCKAAKNAEDLKSVRSMINNWTAPAAFIDRAKASWKEADARVKAESKS